MGKKVNLNLIRNPLQNSKKKGRCEVTARRSANNVWIHFDREKRNR